VNGSGDAPRVVTATLPNGVPVRVELAAADAGDGMTSVGLKDLKLDAALDTVGEIGSVIVDKLKAAKPTRATVELRLGFAVESGKLTALWVGGRGEAALTVTLEWSERDHPALGGGGDG
jgi:Trypsin-co-occurring domain 1